MISMIRAIVRTTDLIAQTFQQGRSSIGGRRVSNATKNSGKIDLFNYSANLTIKFTDEFPTILNQDFCYNFLALLEHNTSSYTFLSCWLFTELIIVPHTHYSSHTFHALQSANLTTYLHWIIIFSHLACCSCLTARL